MHVSLTTSMVIRDHGESVPAALRQQQRVQSLQRGTVFLSESFVPGQHPSFQQILVVAVAAIAHSVRSPGRLAVARILRVTPGRPAFTWRGSSPCRWRGGGWPAEGSAARAPL